MKIGFTGTRKGMTDRQQQELTTFLWGQVPEDGVLDEFHHGDCTGADEEAHWVAQFMSFPIIIHPPLNPEYRSFVGVCQVVHREPKPYLKRNHDIVDETDMLIAAPGGSETLRSGTWATVRYAKKMGKPVIILEP